MYEMLRRGVVLSNEQVGWPMKRRTCSLLCLTALAGTLAAPALAQIQPMGLPAARAPSNQPRTHAPAGPLPPMSISTPATKSGPDALNQTNPDFKAEQAETGQAATIPAPLPPAVWDVVNAEDLLRYIEQIGVEGLNPSDYDPAGLQAAIQSGNIAALSAAATDRFNLVSSDLAIGHVKKPGRIDWCV